MGKFQEHVGGDVLYLVRFMDPDSDGPCSLLAAVGATQWMNQADMLAANFSQDDLENAVDMTLSVPPTAQHGRGSPVLLCVYPPETTRHIRFQNTLTR